MSESDYSHEVAQRCDAVQELITEMINMRRASTTAARAKQNDLSMDVDDHQDEQLPRRLRERAMTGTALLSSLKGLNRDVSQQERHLKNDLAEQKHTVATVNLGYQNILYQRKYLVDEIARCRAMETLYQDVPLVSLEEFKQRAPEHLVNITPKNSTDTNNHNTTSNTDSTDDHQLMLNQLQFELEERKRFDAEKRRLLAVKAQLAKANKARKAQLNRFEKQLEQYIGASAPIQELFRDPTTSAPGGEGHTENMVVEDGEDGEGGGEGGKKGGRVRHDEDEEDERTTRGVAA
ncbi:hypothetical protein BG005_003318 [Podila minutissima]|nr:hypothetical protein BG005_003318 [Podila minutissima]